MLPLGPVFGTTGITVLLAVHAVGLSIVVLVPAAALLSDLALSEISHGAPVGVIHKYCSSHPSLQRKHPTGS